MNRLGDMLSRPPLKKIATIGMIMQLDPFTRELLSEDYERDEDLRGVYEKIKERVVVLMEVNEYQVQDRLLYKIGKLCIPRYRRVQLIREAHTSRVVGHFGVTKTMVNMKEYAYWPKIQEKVANCFGDYVLYSTSNPSNRKLGQCMPLTVPNNP